MISEKHQGSSCRTQEHSGTSLVTLNKFAQIKFLRMNTESLRINVEALRIKTKALRINVEALRINK